LGSDGFGLWLWRRGVALFIIRCFFFTTGSFFFFFGARSRRWIFNGRSTFWCHRETERDRVLEESLISSGGVPWREERESSPRSF
jgi:hypothetical protein